MNKNKNISLLSLRVREKTKTISIIMGLRAITLERVIKKVPKTKKTDKSYCNQNFGNDEPD